MTGAAAKMRAMRRLLVALVLLLAGTARADEYHYSDVFIGPRASGLGGTMIGLADDPSAAYYNPAGLAHADHDTVSLSTTAILGKTLTLENFLGGNLDLDSSAAFSPATISTTPLFSGRLAFMGMTPSFDAYRVSKELESPAPESGVLAARIGRERADSTFLVGLAYGQEVGRGIDLGVTVGYVYRSHREHRSDYRHFLEPRPDGTVAFERIYDEKGISHGLMVVLGLLYHPFGRDGPLRFGINARSGANVSTSASLQQTTFLGRPDPTDPNKVIFDRTAPAAELSGAGSRIPPSLGMGVSWKPMARWTLAADGTFNGFVEYDYLGHLVTKLSTMNGSLATEIELSDDVTMRAGFYTNRTSATRDLQSADLRPDSWDQYGATVGGTLFGKHHSFSVALKYALMNGWATTPVTADENEVLRVSGRELGLVFGGSYYF